MGLLGFRHVDWCVVQILSSETQASRDQDWLGPPPFPAALLQSLLRLRDTDRSVSSIQRILILPEKPSSRRGLIGRDPSIG